MLNPIQLRTLSEVIRLGSFADAARQLGYTPSAVSQQIVALERFLGMPLFEREPRFVRPTVGAVLLVERSKDLLASLDALVLDMRAIAAGMSGRLRLASFPTASSHIVPRALGSLLHQHPGAEVLLDEGEPDELLPALLDGRIDLALVYQYDSVPRSWPGGLVLTSLMSENLLLHLPPGHPRRSARVVELGDLADETWIASKPGTAGAAGLVELCAAAGFVPRIDFRSNNYEVVLGLVGAGLGVALIPTLGHARPSDLDAACLAGPPRQRHVSALHRAENVNPLLPGALASLEEAARSLTE